MRTKDDDFIYDLYSEGLVDRVVTKYKNAKVDGGKAVRKIGRKISGGESKEEKQANDDVLDSDAELSKQKNFVATKIDDLLNDMVKMGLIPKGNKKEVFDKVGSEMHTVINSFQEGGGNDEEPKEEPPPLPRQRSDGESPKKKQRNPKEPPPLPTGDKSQSSSKGDENKRRRKQRPRPTMSQLQQDK